MGHPAEGAPHRSRRILKHTVLDLVNDTKNSGIDRSSRTAKRGNGGAALQNKEDRVADASLGRVNCKDNGPERLVVRRHRLDEQQFRTLKFVVLLGRDDGPDDSP